MSLDKAIEHHKEKRKPYRGAKAIDCTCRNHGSCPWCVENRTHKFRDKEGETAMRVEKTYYAFDETEFDNEADCIAYEDECYRNMGAVAAFDEDLNYIEKPTAEQWEESIMHIEILDGIKAERFVRWIHGWCGMDCDGLYGELHEGDVWAWDNGNAVWYKPLEKLAELQALADRIKKAVDAS